LQAPICVAEVGGLNAFQLIAFSRSVAYYGVSYLPGLKII
jgi:hypothetical protein